MQMLFQNIWSLQSMGRLGLSAAQAMVRRSQHDTERHLLCIVKLDLDESVLHSPVKGSMNSCPRLPPEACGW